MIIFDKGLGYRYELDKYSSPDGLARTEGYWHSREACIRAERAAVERLKKKKGRERDAKLF